MKRMGKISIDKIKIALFFAFVIITLQAKGQDYFQMKCVGFSVHNEDSIKVAHEYLGKIIQISNNVKKTYLPRNKQSGYTIGNRDYPLRQSQTTFEWRGIDYWIVYDRATFSGDYSYLKVTICRPLTHATGVGAPRKMVTLYYTIDLTTEVISNVSGYKKIEKQFK